MGLVDLHFKAVFGPTRLLPGGVKVNPAVRFWFGHDIDFEFKIDERLGVADVEKVATFAVRDNGTVRDGPAIFLRLGDFPTVEGLAIPNRLEAFFLNRLIIFRLRNRAT